MFIFIYYCSSFFTVVATLKQFLFCLCFLVVSFICVTLGLPAKEQLLKKIHKYNILNKPYIFSRSKITLCRHNISLQMVLYYMIPTYLICAMYPPTNLVAAVLQYSRRNGRRNPTDENIKTFFFVIFSRISNFLYE